MATQDTHPERLSLPVQKPTRTSVESGHGIVDRFRERGARRKRARLVTARKRRTLAKWLRRTAAHTQQPHPLVRGRETLLHYRVAAVRIDLLEIAAMLERAPDPDPASVAALHKLLANGCDSPLYNADIHVSELCATLHYVRGGLVAHPNGERRTGASGGICDHAAGWPANCRGLKVLSMVAFGLIAATLMLVSSPATESAWAASRVSVLTSGLENPRGLKFGPDGQLYVAEGGLGGTSSTVGQCPQVPTPVGPYTGGMSARISRIDPNNGSRTTVVDGLPSSTTAPAAGSFVSGVGDVAFLGDRLYAIEAGAGCSHGLARTVNAVLRVDVKHHTTTQVADLSAFVMSHPVANPDPADFEPDGTWYSLVSADGLLYAVEPNHQEVDTITRDGHIRRVIDISRRFPGQTDWRGPTGITPTSGGFYLVNLNPFAPGSNGRANLWKLSKGGELKQITSGLTAGLGVAVHDGQVYALEAFTGTFAPMPSAANTGMVVRLNKHGGWDPVVTGLSFPTAMTFGPDGNLYVSNKGFGQPTNTAGEILRIQPTTTTSQTTRSPKGSIPAAPRRRAPQHLETGAARYQRHAQHRRAHEARD